MAGKIQGEGDRESARRYIEDTENMESRAKSTRRRAKPPKIRTPNARGAREKEFDPKVHRDYSKPRK